MPPKQILERRLKSVFSPGFDSIPSASSGLSGCYVHSTNQLSDALIDNYNAMTPSDSIVVKAAWYGKQTVSLMHEFILIQVEDRRDQEQGGSLINYLVLDRNVLSQSPKSAGSFKYSQASLHGGVAVDTFRVAYDGDVQKLIDDCKLNSHRRIEHLQFPSGSNQPLLYELVSLAYVVSQQHPVYHIIDLNCYFFAGLIWDCLVELYPSAILSKPLDQERGKHGWMRYVIDQSQVKSTCEAASERIAWARLRIEGEKLQLELLVEKAIAKQAVASKSE